MSSLLLQLVAEEAAHGTVARLQRVILGEGDAAGALEVAGGALGIEGDLVGAAVERVVEPLVVVVEGDFLVFTSPEMAQKVPTTATMRTMKNQSFFASFMKPP